MPQADERTHLATSRPTSKRKTSTERQLPTGKSGLRKNNTASRARRQTATRKSLHTTSIGSPTTAVRITRANNEADFLAAVFVFAVLLSVVLAIGAAIVAAFERKVMKIDSRRLHVINVKKVSPEESPSSPVEPEIVALASTAPLPALSAPELDQPLMTPAIKQLVDEAAAPVVGRRRTLSEWLNDVDIREKQLAHKIQAGRTAVVLVQQRTELIAAVGEMVRTASGIRRQILEDHLAELRLQDEIVEHVAVRNGRLRTQIALEQERQRQLLEPPAPPPPQPSERDLVLAEHRQDRLDRAKAGDQMLEDFLREVHLICESRAGIHERALRLRNLLDVFEIDEESMPADARWILRTSEKFRDAS